MRKTLASIALSGLLLTGFAAPAMPPATAAEQLETEHQISDLTLTIANDPRLLALGFTNSTAYAGAKVHANAVAPGAARLEYYWLSTSDDGPSPDHIDEGPDFTVGGADHFYNGEFNSVRGAESWPFRAGRSAA